MIKLFAIILLTFVILTTGNCFSQESANITATATVLTRISVTSKSDLNFGVDIVPGYKRIIAKTDATSGRISISGQPSKQISISFVTPSALSNGSSKMPITFATTDAGYQIPGGSVIAFNPTTVTNATFGTAGTMTIFLGGTVTPSGTQDGGLYTAVVTVNLQFTGN